MFDLYQSPATAAHRQAELYAEVAADRLARSASESDQASTDDSQSPAPRLTVLVTDVLASAHQRHPRRDPPPAPDLSRDR